MRKTFRVAATAAVIALIAGLTTAGQAVAGESKANKLKLYDDRAKFLKQTDSASATGPIPLDPSLKHGGTIGSVTFSTPSANMPVGHPHDWTLLSPGQDIAIGGVEHLDARFDQPVRAAGFDFVEESCTNSRWTSDPALLCPDGGIGTNTPPAAIVDSEFEVTLLLDGDAVGLFRFNAPDDQVSFVGVRSKVPFDTLSIREVIGTADNEYFGEFYSGGRPNNGDNGTAWR